MLLMNVVEWDATGRRSTRWFHGLLGGKILQPGAPPRGFPDARVPSAASRPSPTAAAPSSLEAAIPATVPERGEAGAGGWDHQGHEVEARRCAGPGGRGWGRLRRPQHVRGQQALGGPLRVGGVAANPGRRNPGVGGHPPARRRAWRVRVLLVAEHHLERHAADRAPHSRRGSRVQLLAAVRGTVAPYVLLRPVYDGGFPPHRAPGPGPLW